MKIQIEDRFIYIMNNVIGEAHFNSVFVLQRNNSIRDLFVVNFVINGKVTSLPKVIKYM